MALSDIFHFNWLFNEYIRIYSIYNHTKRFHNVGFRSYLLFKRKKLINLLIFSRPYPLTSITEEQSTFWIYFHMLSNISVWFLIFVSIIAALLPDMCLAVLNNFLEKRRFRTEYERMKKEHNYNHNIKKQDVDNNSPKATQIVTKNNSRKNSKSRRRYSIHKIQDVSSNNNNNIIDMNNNSHENRSFIYDDIIGFKSINPELDNFTFVSP
jgi:hypothetical protein